MKKHSKSITAQEFDIKFDRGQDITQLLDLKNISIVKKVNVDFPIWMIKLLDREATKLNISRQAIIKMWVRDRLDPQHHISL